MTRSDVLPAGFQKWNKLFDNLNWKKVCSQNYKSLKWHTTSLFQMWLLQRILPTGKYLFLRKIIDSPLCSFCKQEEETIAHLFWGCTVIQSFWSDLQTLIKEICINCTHFELSEALVLFGVTDNIITDKVIDLFILLAEFLLNCWTLSLSPSLVLVCMWVGVWVRKETETVYVGMSVEVYVQIFFFLSFFSPSK